jgi:hypothetical protein
MAAGPQAEANRLVQDLAAAVPDRKRLVADLKAARRAAVEGDEQLKELRRQAVAAQQAAMAACIRRDGLAMQLVEAEEAAQARAGMAEARLRQSLSDADRAALHDLYADIDHALEGLRGAAIVPARAAQSERRRAELAAALKGMRDLELAENVAAAADALRRQLQVPHRPQPREIEGW